SGLLVKHRALKDYFDETKPDIGVATSSVQDHLFLSFATNDYLKGDSILFLYVLLDSFLVFFFLVIEAEEDQAVDVDSDVPNELARFFKLIELPMVSLFYAFHCYVVMFSLMQVTMQVVAHYRASDYMKSQHEINEMVRLMTMDWLAVELTIAEPHIVNLSAINSKFLLDCWNHRLKTSLSISDIAYYKNHILPIGKAILKRLEWYLTFSTPCLSLIIRDFGQTDQQMENMVFFLAELGLVHYQTTILFLPIMTATTALYAARCIINRRPILKHKLKHLFSFSLFICFLEWYLVNFSMLYYSVIEVYANKKGAAQGKKLRFGLLVVGTSVEKRDKRVVT
ncbi:Cyclin-B1-1, partial [Mucuna pruriens]